MCDDKFCAFCRMPEAAKKKIVDAMAKEILDRVFKVETK